MSLEIHGLNYPTIIICYKHDMSLSKVYNFSSILCHPKKDVHKMTRKTFDFWALGFEHKMSRAERRSVVDTYNNWASNDQSGVRETEMERAYPGNGQILFLLHAAKFASITFLFILWIIYFTNHALGRVKLCKRFG